MLRFEDRRILPVDCFRSLKLYVTENLKKRQHKQSCLNNDNRKQNKSRCSARSRQLQSFVILCSNIAERRKTSSQGRTPTLRRTAVWISPSAS